MKALAARVAETVSAVLLVLAFVLIQALVGGTRLIFSLPSCGLLALIGVLAIFSLGRAKPRPDQFCLASSGIFFGYILARAYLSPAPYLAQAGIYSVLGCLLVYLFVACVLTGAKPRMLVVCFLIAAGLVHVVVGGIQFTEGHNFMPISFLGRFDYGRRASGLYVCPNHLAALLEVLGIFGLSIACWSRWPMWAKMLIAYGAGICYLGLALTGSRTGYLSTMVSLAVFAILGLTVLVRTSAKLFWRIGVPFAVLAVVICVGATLSIRQSNYLGARADNLLGEDLADPSAGLRTQLWQIALRQWRLEPVWGTGSGTYLYYGRLFRTDAIPGDPVYAHNDYVQLLAEYGAIGGAGFLLFLGLHLRRGWKNFARLGPKRIASSVSPSLPSNGLALNIGALSAATANLVHSIFDFNLHIPANALLLAFVFGLLANGGTQRGGEAPAPTASIVLWRLLLPLIGVFMAIQCARLLPGEYFAERARVALADPPPETGMNFALRGLATEHNNPYLYQYFATAQIQKADSSTSMRERRSLYRTALKALETARSLAPKDETFVLALAFAYDGAERFAEAEWMYGEAMALDPNSRFLGQVYQAHLRKWRGRANSSQSLTEPAAKSQP